MIGSVGDVTAREAYDKLKSEAKAQIVDVRTRAEWSFVGVPDLTGLGKEVILAEWQHYPEMEVVSDFVANLGRELASRGVGHDDPVLYICRSGARSLAAAEAMMNAGWSNSHNVAGGFEGPPDKDRHRGKVDGWKAAGLPWIQT
jgi:rhodanese-related sulfurtransferase